MSNIKIFSDGGELKMSDRDPIWESEYIIDNLLFWSKDRIQNEKELSYLLRYQTLCSHYYKSKTEAEKEFYEKELAKLENTKIIKEIVEREGPDDLILEMTFAKTTLNRTEEKTTPTQKKNVFNRILELLR